MTTETTTPDAPAGAAVTPSLGRLATWRYVLNTANLPEGVTKPDAISKWLPKLGGRVVAIYSPPH